MDADVVVEGTVSPARAQRRVLGHLAASLAFSWLVVVGARMWFDMLQRVWPTTDDTLEGLQFGSFLLVLGGVLSWWWSGDSALRIGSTLEAWRVVLPTAMVAAVLTWLAVAATGANAYSDADALFEILLVPVGEELVFRGVLLGWLLQRLGRASPGPAAVRTAVVVSAVAFGSAHLSNVLFGVGSFALVQVLVATIMGLVFGALRVRTGSLAAPIAVHALVNAINLLG